MIAYIAPDDTPTVRVNVRSPGATPIFGKIRPGGSERNQALTQSATIGQFKELIAQPLAFTHRGLPVLVASRVIPHKALEVAAIRQFAVGQLGQVVP